MYKLKERKDDGLYFTRFKMYNFLIITCDIWYTHVVPMKYYIKSHMIYIQFETD